MAPKTSKTWSRISDRCAGSAIESTNELKRRTALPVRLSNMPAGREEDQRVRDRRNPCLRTWSSEEGRAKFSGDKTVGSLKVSFFGPFYGDHHIVGLDKDYQHALVAGPSKNYLWTLSHSPEIREETSQQMVDKARKPGFSTKDLIHVSHQRGRERKTIRTATSGLWHRNGWQETRCVNR